PVPHDRHQQHYDRAVDAYRVEQDAWKTAIEEGREEGREEGIRDMARKLKALGVAVKDIISASGLSESVVASL
ncbi:MAG: hypothetical protein K2H75_08280, partial [Muribaculaceae bacterium]|nr:hypothetical protein [Muribaculaceae bacterium]